MSADNFTGQFISSTFQRLLQLSDNGDYVTDGTGSVVQFLPVTASYVLNGGGGPETDPIFVAKSASLATTGSNTFIGNQTITGSIVATSGFTGSLFGTSSWAESASYVLSSSYATTASYALNGGVTKITAGSGITISPTTGLGDVTINSTAAAYNTMTGSYGSFYDTGSQNAVLATTIYSMSLSTTDISNGVYISGSDNTKIKVTNAGVYNLQFSAQFRNTHNNVNEGVAVWLRKNDGSSTNDIVDSNSFITVPGAKGADPGETIAAWNFFLQLAAGDFVQLLWHAESDNYITLETIAAGTSPTHPRTPSLIATVQRVDTFLSNTGSFSGSFTGQLIGTSSWASNYNESDPIFVAKSASFATTGSNTFIGNQTITGSVNITGSFSLNVNITPPTNPPAKVGLFYFTNTDLYISLD